MRERLKAEAPEVSPLRLGYLALETPKVGQASYTHIHEVARALDKLGWHIELFATSRGGASAGGWRIVRVADYLNVQLRLMLRLREFDAVFIRSHPAAIVIAVAARLMRKPVFHEVNGSDLDLWITYPKLHFLRWPVQLAWRLQLGIATHIFCVTDGLLAWATGQARHQRASVVSNGADTEHFKPYGKKADVNCQRYVVFVGGLVAWHGLQCMTDALSDECWPANVDLLIIGDGPARQLVQRALGNCRLHWMRHVPYDEIPDYLRGAVAALCVIEDTQGRASMGVAPLKLFEAMACGVPVIVSDLPFQGDLVRSINSGLVVPEGSPEDLAKAVAVLADCSGESSIMGAAGAQYVACHASWRHRAAELDREMRSAVLGAK